MKIIPCACSRDTVTCTAVLEVYYSSTVGFKSSNQNASNVFKFPVNDIDQQNQLPY